ncbi:hypothetical protein BV898_04394 [Hypsibius exemplaris]|uniref:Uncharacterized protein n=1 Tax=Hypsibius exemplaris TaxID=2072580 RepID=A0A1W0X2Y5_HYPEX|nr:hypothetical protein BV898_04394 [Hypsibius exemplaris]
MDNVDPPRQGGLVQGSFPVVISNVDVDVSVPQENLHRISMAEVAGDMQCRAAAIPFHQTCDRINGNQPISYPSK